MWKCLFKISNSRIILYTYSRPTHFKLHILSGEVNSLSKKVKSYTSHSKNPWFVMVLVIANLLNIHHFQHAKLDSVVVTLSLYYTVPQKAVVKARRNNE